MGSAFKLILSFVFLLQTQVHARDVNMPDGSVRAVPDQRPEQSEADYRRFLLVHFGVAEDYDLNAEKVIIEKYNPYLYENYRATPSNLSVGRTITVDTRDQENCKKVQSAILNVRRDSSVERLCLHDKEKPYSTIVIVNKWDDSIEYQTKIGDLSNDDITNTRNLTLMGVFSFLRILSKPLAESNWKKLTWSNVDESWIENVQKTPWIDDDSFSTNYIEHPVAGAIYFSVARHSGYSFMQSFAYSVVMSTFMWEYGIEAIPERPSLNDLLATPILGSLLGEAFYQLAKGIRSNNGRLLGSKAVGTAASILLEPGYFLSETMNSILGKSIFKSGETLWVMRDYSRTNRNLPMPLRKSNALILQMKLKF